MWVRASRGLSDGTGPSNGPLGAWRSPEGYGVTFTVSTWGWRGVRARIGLAGRVQ